MSDRAAESRTTEEIAADCREHSTKEIGWQRLLGEAADHLEQQSSRITELEVKNERLRAVIERARAWAAYKFDERTKAAADGLAAGYGWDIFPLVVTVANKLKDEFYAALAETETK